LMTCLRDRRKILQIQLCGVTTERTVSAARLSKEY
jgi:hypothetical protein